MSLPDFESAEDEILDMFRTYWNTQSAPLNGGFVVPVQWPGVDTGSEPDPTKPYVRIRIRHATGRQTTFGPVGSRRFHRPGRVSAQVFVPITIPGGFTLSGKLGIIVRDAFEGRGTASGIWFRRSEILDAGNDGNFHQQNVTVEFEYDELK